MKASRDVRSEFRVETLAIHAGQVPDPSHGAVMSPIVLSSTFAQPEPGKPRPTRATRPT